MYMYLWFLRGCMYMFLSVTMFMFILNCIALYCIVLLYTVLYSTVLYYCTV